MVAWLSIIGKLDCPEIAGTLLIINVSRIRQSMICITGWYNEAIANLKKGVTPAKAGVQKFLNRLDSRLRGNDNLGLLQLALTLKVMRPDVQIQDHIPRTAQMKCTCYFQSSFL
jgi:hypothetical protein